MSRYSLDELLGFERDFADPPTAEQAGDDQAESAPRETLGNGRGARTSSTASAVAQSRALASPAAGAQNRHDSALARQERAVRAALQAHDRAGTGRPSRAAMDERRVRDAIYGTRSGRVVAAPIRPPVSDRWPR